MSSCSIIDSERSTMISLPRLTRRGFLQAGVVSFGGASLANLLRNEPQAGATANDRRSVILCFQSGGPSQIDMWDMKPDSPIEYRGEFTTIPTNLPGYRVCDLMPRLAPQ